jgi:hypothetical protein
MPYNLANDFKTYPERATKKYWDANNKLSTGLGALLKAAEDAYKKIDFKNMETPTVVLSTASGGVTSHNEKQLLELAVKAKAYFDATVKPALTAMKAAHDAALKIETEPKFKASKQFAENVVKALSDRIEKLQSIKALIDPHTKTQIQNITTLNTASKR